MKIYIVEGGVGRQIMFSAFYINEGTIYNVEFSSVAGPVSEVNNIEFID